MWSPRRRIRANISFLGATYMSVWYWMSKIYIDDSAWMYQLLWDIDSYKGWRSEFRKLANGTSRHHWLSQINWVIGSSLKLVCRWYSDSLILDCQFTTRDSPRVRGAQIDATRREERIPKQLKYQPDTGLNNLPMPIPERGGPKAGR